MTLSRWAPSLKDMARDRLHRFLRSILVHYPTRLGAAWLNRRLDRWLAGPPRWLLAPGRGEWPTMELDIATSHQRKFFYFPKLYGRFYGRTVFRDYLETTLTAGATFLDIGSNVGFFALMAARRVGPTGRVYAFEPDPEICECLVRSAKANTYSQVEAFQLALSDRDGELRFYRATDGTASSLVPEAPGREHRYTAAALTTRVTTLDALVRAGRLDPRGIALVKVDVEGEEVRTVTGMRETLVAAGHPPIWCEVRGPQGSSRAPNTYVAVRDRLKPLGYKPYWWSKAGMRPVFDDEVVKRADVLFERH